MNFNAKIKIKEGLRGASKGYFPISIDKLKEENKVAPATGPYIRRLVGRKSDG